MTEIILQKNDLPGGGVKFDLIGKNLPQNFLGIAADIDWKKTFAGANYKGMVLSADWQHLSDAGNLINLAKAIPEQGKVVFGITLKPGGLAKITDGVIASFVFSDQKVEPVAFSNQVLSVFESGRKDLPVKWTIVSPNSSLKVGVQAASPVVNAPNLYSQEFLGLDNGVQSNLNQNSLQKLINLPFQQDGFQLASGWWIIALLAIFTLIVGYVVFRFGILKRRAGAGADLELGRKADFA